METIDPTKLLAAIAGILNKLGVPYMVTGGMAVTVWGKPRFTADIDIVIELENEQIPALAHELRTVEEAGYIDEETMRTALAQKSEFNFVSPSTGVKVDFWIIGRDPFDKKRLARRVGKKFHGESVYFTSAEDLILTKLRWYEKSGSSRHLEDAQSIMKIQSQKLDMPYLKREARKLGVAEELRKLIAQKA